MGGMAKTCRSSAQKLEAVAQFAPSSGLTCCFVLENLSRRALTRARARMNAHIKLELQVWSPSSSYPACTSNVRRRALTFEMVMTLHGIPIQTTCTTGQTNEAAIGEMAQHRGTRRPGNVWGLEGQGMSP
eukprot:5884425-Amphidinium_carterae.1